MKPEKTGYWDTNKDTGPQPACTSGDMDHETGAMPYSYNDELRDKRSEELGESEE